MKGIEILRFLDVTTLSVEDSEESVGRWAKEVMERCEELNGGVGQDPTPLLPAALCVYPNFVDAVGMAIGDSPVRIASVAGGFPAGQTYLEVKMLEAAMAVENGADEIDIVLNLGAFLSGQHDVAASEIALLRGEIGTDITLKVIIESGLLQNRCESVDGVGVPNLNAIGEVEMPNLDLVRRATRLAAEAGADFVKTSTGKTAVGATPEAVRAMCEELRDHAAATGREVGIKIAGGVRTLVDAAAYIDIVREVLGDRWLIPSLLRIGTSSLLAQLEVRS